MLIILFACIGLFYNEFAEPKEKPNIRNINFYEAHSCEGVFISILQPKVS